MMLCVLVILAAGLALQASAQGVCPKGRVERERTSLEEMWTVYQKLDCSRENLDAATTLPDTKTFFFKGDYYWRLLENKVDPGYPRHISQDWNGLPGHLDAALTWKDNRTFFFKGHEYWSFQGQEMDEGYPRNISEGFCGIPDNLDAALLWKPDNTAYFFKGDQYWRFDGGDSCVPVLKDFPKSIHRWRGIPANVDAAMQWKNGITYFFKGAHYYRYYHDGSSSGPVLLHKNWGLKCSDLNCRIPSEYEIQAVK